VSSILTRSILLLLFTVTVFDSLSVGYLFHTEASWVRFPVEEAEHFLLRAPPTRPAGLMVRRGTSNAEIAGSSPALV
jgi:hypothetical protein